MNIYFDGNRCNAIASDVQRSEIGQIKQSIWERVQIIAFNSQRSQTLELADARIDRRYITFILNEYLALAPGCGEYCWCLTKDKYFNDVSE